MNRFKRLVIRHGMRSMPLPIARDWAMDHSYSEGKMKFDGMRKGMIVGVNCIDFPYIGEVVEFDDSRVVLKGAVKVLWDGRHHETWQQGKPPPSAEIEATLPLYRISEDAVIGWGEFPGKIPKTQ